MNFLSPDDPLLTAYAFNELEGDERTAVEAALAAQPALQTRLAEIRATADRLKQAFAEEPDSKSATEASGVAQPGLLSKPDLQSSKNKMPWRKLIQFPQAYYAVGALAAACFAVLVAWHEPLVQMESAKKRYVEVALPVMPAPEDGTSSSIALIQADVESPPATLALPPLKPVKFTTDLAFNEDHAVTESAVKPLLEASRAAEDSASVPLRSKSSVTFSPGEKGKISDPVVPKAELRTYAAAEAEKTSSGRSVRIEGVDAAYGYIGRTNLTTPFGERIMPPDFNTEAYGYRRDNTFVSVMDEPLSTFSIDVDTASYANVRRFLQAGELPPPAAVRIEELVNYFPYRYPAPDFDNGSPQDEGTLPTLRERQKQAAPFAASLEVASAPWQPKHRLVRIGLKGREATQAARPAANLVFLLDVSGSMSGANRLPLVKESLHLLLGKLRADDRVAIVTYAGNSGLALPSTPVEQSAKIRTALDALTPGGSTNGAMGIQLAYDIAKANFVPDGVNRIVLCTDGDFNVGATSQGELVRLIEAKAKTHVFLTVLGFGMGNLKDSTLELLADKGNGHYGYIDSRREAEKLLVEQVAGTLVTIAKDVKIQVEFNPAQVNAYRLIGYENRLLNKPDFNNDQVDAGEIGAGHTVTALYEVVPVEGESQKAEGGRPEVDELKYRRVVKAENNPRSAIRDPQSQELLTVKIRYKEPTGDVSKKLEFPLVDRGTDFEDASGDFKFAAAVAGFGLALRSEPAKSALLADVARWADAGLSDDPGGYRAEFAGLVRQAQALVR